MHHHFATALAALGLSIGFAGAGQAADIARPAPVYTKAPPPAVVSSWTGFYGGLDAGYGAVDPTATQSDTLLSNTPGSPANALNPLSVSLNKSGFLAGGHIGYNYQFAPTWVAGIEADFDWANIKASGSTGPLSFNPAAGATGTLYGGVTMQATYRDPWSIRGRIGYAQPAYMVYATGGFAQLNVGFSGNWIDCGSSTPCTPGGFQLTASTSTSQERSGWVAGGGIEWKPVPGPWILGLEYLHYGFEGTTTASGPVVGITPPLCSVSSKESSCMHFSLGDINLDAVRARVSYKFGN